ncbi:hypothetical protein Y032_0213g2280 [Ancylostoma ceylanicum]|uniref:Uncharacterized protein n=1 Tax=Ancylostoma ceylanicum TaxID=53326 RepID=A0A016SKF7_9BILA|nr:hypothetical protein Y032_0213g2280 [Ancylostoma ceylanicum]
MKNAHCDDFEIELNNQLVERVEHYVYLGQGWKTLCDCSSRDDGKQVGCVFKFSSKTRTYQHRPRVNYSTAACYLHYFTDLKPGT